MILIPQDKICDIENFGPNMATLVNSNWNLGIGVTKQRMSARAVCYSHNPPENQWCS